MSVANESTTTAEPRRRRDRRLVGAVGVAVAALFAALLPGVAHADSQPVISEITLTPTGVAAAGGTVTISAQIESDVGWRVPRSRSPSRPAAPAAAR